MATYSLISTENLGNDQIRNVNAYEITGAGVIVNIEVSLTISTAYQSDTKLALVDEEVFVPGIKLSDLTGLSFNTTQTVNLDKGQKRLIREMDIPVSGGKIISVVATIDFKQGKVTKSIVRSEEVLYTPNTSSNPGVTFKPPRGTWVSGTAVNFASRPGQPSKNELRLPDGRLRSFTGTLAWSHSNLVLDLGWDEASSYAAGDKWIFFYVVPQTGNDRLLTIVASDNPPSTGPTGRPVFKICWVDFRASGNLLKVRQSGNHFSHGFRTVFTDADVNDENSYTSVSLVNFAPETASHIGLYHCVTAYSTQTSQDLWQCRLSMSASDSDTINLLDLRTQWDTQRTPKEITSISDFYIPSVPITHTGITATTRVAAPTAWRSAMSENFEAAFFSARTIWKKRDRVSGSSQPLLNDLLQCTGWVDEWIEP